MWSIRQAFVQREPAEPLQHALLPLQPEQKSVGAGCIASCNPAGRCTAVQVGILAPLAEARRSRSCSRKGLQDTSEGVGCQPSLIGVRSACHGCSRQQTDLVSRACPSAQVGQAEVVWLARLSSLIEWSEQAATASPMCCTLHADPACSVHGAAAAMPLALGRAAIASCLPPGDRHR